MPLTPTEKADPTSPLHEAASTWWQDPLGMIGTVWPHVTLYRKQADVIESVRDNIETFVPAANEVGKDFAAALVVLWWMSSRFPARVITTSVKESQLKDVLWGEIRSLLKSAKVPLGLTCQHLRLHSIDPETRQPHPKHECIGSVAREMEGSSGYHLPQTAGIPRVLVVVDEGTGVADSVHEVAQSEAHRILVVTNTRSISNFVFHECRRGDDLPRRKVITIAASDTPNVAAGIKWAAEGRKGPEPIPLLGPLTFSQYEHRLHVWDKVKVHTRIHGLFYEGSDASMFPPDVLDACEEAWVEMRNAERFPRAMGIDVAEGGRDLNVWVILDQFGIVEIVAVASDTDTTTIQKRTLALMAKHNIADRNICIDYGGGGKGHHDYLRPLGVRIKTILFGEGATNKRRYKNRRAEMFGLLSERMNPIRWATVETLADDGKAAGHERTSCFCLPPDEHELREELSVLPVLSDGEGRQWMLPKSRKPGTSQNTRTLEELLHRSPDRADALALACWAMYGKTITPVASGSLVYGRPAEPKTPEEAKAREDLCQRILGRPRIPGV